MLVRGQPSGRVQLVPIYMVDIDLRRREARKLLIPCVTCPPRSGPCKPHGRIRRYKYGRRQYLRVMVSELEHECDAAVTFEIPLQIRAEM